MAASTLLLWSARMIERISLSYVGNMAASISTPSSDAGGAVGAVGAESATATGTTIGGNAAARACATMPGVIMSGAKEGRSSSSGGGGGGGSSGGGGGTSLVEAMFPEPLAIVPDERGRALGNAKFDQTSLLRFLYFIRTRGLLPKTRRARASIRQCHSNQGTTFWTSPANLLTAAVAAAPAFNSASVCF